MSRTLPQSSSTRVFICRPRNPRASSDPQQPPPAYSAAVQGCPPRPPLSRKRPRASSAASPKSIGTFVPVDVCKSHSSPLLYLQPPSVYPSHRYPVPHHPESMPSNESDALDSDDDGLRPHPFAPPHDDDGAIYTRRPALRRSSSSTLSGSGLGRPHPSAVGHETPRGPRARASMGSLRHRFWGTRSPHRPIDGDAQEEEEVPKPITTRCGAPCAGETETDTDGETLLPRRAGRLPNVRNVPRAPPLVPPRAYQRMTPLLFEAARLLSIVPAIFGSLWNVYHAWDLPDDPRLWRVDYLVAVLWCVLTGWQCLRLTTGLLTRWRVYYTPLSTLIRLLALQAICWPATNFTLTAFGYEKRPVVCWAIVGTTTCCSRAIQMWVTSNLVSSSSAHRRPPLPPRRSSNSAVPLHAHAHASNSYSGPSSLGSPPPYSASTPALPTMYPSAPSSAAPSHSTTARRQEGWLDGVLDALVGADVMDDVDMLPSPRRGGRRWDWRAVGIRCALPAGAVYFVMAWAEAIRREWAGC